MEWPTIQQKTPSSAGVRWEGATKAGRTELLSTVRIWPWRERGIASSRVPDTREGPLLRSATWTRPAPTEGNDPRANTWQSDAWNGKRSRAAPTRDG